MQLNDIKLSGHLLTALYANSLVITETSETRPETPAPPDSNNIPVEIVQYLGKNTKKFTILVQYPDQLHIPDESFNFLGNVLKACHLNASDVAIVNLARQSITHEILVQQLEPKIILDFTPAETLPGLPAAVQLQPLRTVRYQYLQAPSLEMLNKGGDAAKPQKKQLWESLKQMLQI